MHIEKLVIHGQFKFQDVYELKIEFLFWLTDYSHMKLGLCYQIQDYSL